MVEDEFCSKLEDLMATEELIFEPTPGFGRWRKFFPEDAIRHPAKANLNLIDFLIDRYSREGDLILDPMAGTGSTCVLATLKGRDAICVDIEPLFYQWMEKAREIVEKTPMLGRKGRMINILGDARRLSELLKQIDIIITSPPYGDTYLGGGDPERRAERLIKAGYDPKAFLGGRARNAVLKHYSEADVVITSPPYADMKRGSSDPDAVERYAERWERYAREKRWNTWSLNFHTEGRLRSAEALIRGYSDNPDNIGNLPLGNIDTIITSPPYAETISHKSGGPVKKIVNVGISTITARTYSENENNIDNLPLGDMSRSEDRPTYFSEMLKVYNEMYKVLKPNGYAIVFIKPFIRNKQVIDLPYYTWLMMKKAGFRLEKIYKLKLKTQSFWRVLYYKKNPDVPRIDHEYILVCRK